MSHVQPLSTDVRVKVKALPQYKVLSSLQRRVKKSTRKVADKRKKKKQERRITGKLCRGRKARRKSAESRPKTARGRDGQSLMSQLLFNIPKLFNYERH